MFYVEIKAVKNIEMINYVEDVLECIVDIVLVNVLSSNMNHEDTKI